jgi:hypothetical protein
MDTDPDLADLDDEGGSDQVDFTRRTTVDGRMFSVAVRYMSGSRLAIDFSADNEHGDGVTSLLRGEIEVGDLLPARQALVSLLNAVAAMFGPARAGATIDLNSLRRRYPHAGQSWTKDEETRLIERRKAGLSIDELTHGFGRRRGAIHARLGKLGLLLNDQTEPAGPVKPDELDELHDRPDDQSEWI